MIDSIKRTLTIATRDFKALIATPMFFVISGMCALVWSFRYIRVISEFSAESMRMVYQSRGQSEGLSLHFVAFVQHISLTNLLLIMAVPAITMRLLSEEKKMRTYDLLLTSPVNATHIAVGKFLGGFAAASVLILISFLYPLSTALFTEIQWEVLLSSYFGLWLLVGLYVAMGIFASSLTESVMLAIMMGLIFNISLWFIGSAEGAIENQVWKAVFSHLSLGEHFLSFIRGSIKTSAIVFFLSLITLNCFLTQRVVESSRWR